MIEGYIFYLFRVLFNLFYLKVFNVKFKILNFINNVELGDYFDSLWCILVVIIRSWLVLVLYI